MGFFVLNITEFSERKSAWIFVFWAGELTGNVDKKQYRYIDVRINSIYNQVVYNYKTNDLNLNGKQENRQARRVI